MPGTLLGVEDTEIDRTDKVACLSGVHNLEQQYRQQIRKHVMYEMVKGDAEKN